MGIHYFYGRWIAHLGDGVNVRNIPAGVEGVILDMNGLLHEVAQRVYLYGGAREILGGAVYAQRREERARWKPARLLDLFVEDLTRTLNVIVIDEMQPRQYVIMAVDGVAPAAKIKQQRERRYRDAAAYADGEVDAPLGGFTSAVISPGTKFMTVVDHSLEKWISASMRASRGARPALPGVVYYTSHLVPGEGEHKAVEALRDLVARRIVHQGRGAHVIHGLDSDLVVLGVLLPVHNVYAARGKRSVSIDALFRVIRRSMTRDGTAPSANFDEDTLHRDFAVIVTLVGNDFMPHMLGFERVSPALFDAYAAVGAPLSNADGDILTAPAALFYAEVHRRFAPLALAEAEIHDEGTKDARLERTNALSAAYDGATRTFDTRVFRTEWYATAARLHAASASVAGGDAAVVTPAATRARMVCEYAAAVAWTLRYYAIGGRGVNWLFAYQFHIAPLALDVSAALAAAAAASPTLRQFAAGCLPGGGVSELDGPRIARGKTAVAPVHQLLAITPPSRVADVVSSEALADIVRRGELAPFSPNPGEYMLFSEGKLKEHTRVPILPQIDLYAIVAAVDRAEDASYARLVEEFNSPEEVEKRFKQAVSKEYEYDRKGNIKFIKRRPPKRTIVPSSMGMSAVENAKPLLIKPFSRVAVGAAA